MPGPVERWLETFMCKQYADLFEAYGFKTLHSVCQLQPSTLHSMGIPPEHCDKILENVSVLRQSLVASSPEHMGSHESGLPYGLRRNLQSPHYSGTVGPGYPEHGYDHQMSGQSNNYSYHSSSSYSTHHQQYCGPGGQVNHTMSYSNNESFSGNQSHYSNQSHPDVYAGQSLYNNRLHPSHGSWDDPMGIYNHPSRHVMGSSPPPTSSIMRSPPPPPPPPPSTPSSGSVSLPHYPRHVMDALPPTAHHHHHHHTWSQGQLLTSGSMGSPRGTPSPGMAHPSSSLSSPSIAGCSPAHGKPFSPPPYSPLPPPAHQQSPVAAAAAAATAYDYPPPVSISSPSRHLGSPSVVVTSSSPSDPLQSLQKMVLLDAQGAAAAKNGPPKLLGQQQQQSTTETPQLHEGQSPNPQHPIKPIPKFSSVEQLASSATSPSSSSSPLVSQRTKTPSPSTGKSSNIDTPSPSDDRTSDSSTSAFASNEGSTVDSTSYGKANSNSSSSTNDGSASVVVSAATTTTTTRTARLPVSLEEEDNNTSSLDVVGHDNDSVPANSGFSEVFDAGKCRTELEETKATAVAANERRNGCASLSPIHCDVKPVVDDVKPARVPIVVANGIDGGDHHADDCDATVERKDLIERHRKDAGICLGVAVGPPKFESPSPRRNRRKQCLSPYASSKTTPPPPFLVNNHYACSSSEEFKVNGGGGGSPDEKVELTELKPVLRAIGSQGTLSAIGALEAVHQCHEVHDECPPLSQQQQPVGGSRSLFLSASSTAVNRNLPPLAKSPRRRRKKSLGGFDECISGDAFQRRHHVGGGDQVRLSDVPKLAACHKTVIVAPPPPLTAFGTELLGSAGSRDSVLKQGASAVVQPDSLCQTTTPVVVAAADGTKPRRGRPPGSKNKPKPPGYEKESKVTQAKSSNKVVAPATTVDTPPVFVATPLPPPPPPPLRQTRCVAVNTDIVATMPPPPPPLPRKQPQCVDVRLRGPYVRLKGSSRGHPDSVTVVNIFSKDTGVEDAGDVKGSCRRKRPVVDETVVFKRRMMAVGFSSTLSANYDVFTKDKSWVCALCHRGSHYKGLGDLFGPYFDETATDASPPTLPLSLPPPDRPVGKTVPEVPAAATSPADCSPRLDEKPPVLRKVRAKRKRTELVEDFIKSTMAKKGKRSRDLNKIPTLSEETASAVPPPSPPAAVAAAVTNASDQKKRNSVLSSTATAAVVRSAVQTQEQQPAYSLPVGGSGELWVHEDCVVWSHGVYLLGRSVVGLVDAIKEADALVCSKCHEGGATVGCLQKGCSEQYHFICAIEKGCQFNDENFTVFCSKHRRKSEPHLT